MFKALMLVPGAGSIVFWLGLLLAAQCVGCRTVRNVAEVPVQTVRAVTPGKKDKNVDPVEVQQKLLRFADEFSTRLDIGLEMLRRGTNAVEPANLLHWKIALISGSTSIASGPNSIANLLDMTIFVTLTRMAIEQYWPPDRFGEAVQPLLESCRNAETQIWQIAGTVLKTEQQAELRQAVEGWLRQNPNPESLLAVRALGFAGDLARVNPAATAKPESVFGLLGVDPLVNMDPAVREIAQTRLFAERTLFVTQRMPNLLRWQTELLGINALAMPSVQQLITNSTHLAAGVERFAGVAEKLPGRLTAEREELVKALDSQEKNLTPLVKEVRETLTAASQMSTSLNTTISTFDGLMKRFGVGETNSSSLSETNSEPFRIQDYAETATKLEAAARQLTELVLSFDRTLGSSNLAQLSVQIGPVVQQAQSGGKQVVDYAFWKAVLFSIILAISLFVYRFLSHHATRSPKSTPT